MKKSLISLIFLLFTVTVIGQVRSEQSRLPFYFRFDKAVLDLSYMTNCKALAELDQMVEKFKNCADSVIIEAYASPEGNIPYNQRLSAQRAGTIRKLLQTRYPDVSFNNIIIKPHGADFDGLARMIQADEKVPYRTEAIEILSLENVNPDKKFRELTVLRGGVTYTYIRRNILPYLRSAAACIFFYDEETLIAEEAAKKQAEEEAAEKQAEEDARQAESAKNQYKYTIATSAVYKSDGTPAEGLTMYSVKVYNDNEGVVSEYKLVAPNGTTNLSGWYSLTTTPSTSNDALSGSFEADSSVDGSYIVRDGRQAALTQGKVEIRQSEDGTMDFVLHDTTSKYADGTTEKDEQIAMSGKGSGVPVVEKTVLTEQLTYTVTASDIEGASEVSLYTITVRDAGEGIVGEYQLVAPNGISNLSGWYRLTPAPTVSSRARSGEYTADGVLQGSYINTADGSYALDGGIVNIRQAEDGTISIICENTKGIAADGSVTERRIEMTDIKGDGIPFVSKKHGQTSLTEPSLPVSPVLPIADSFRTYTINAKTNMLFDLVGAVNVGVEVPIGKRFSVDANWLFPWYVAKNWSWCYQLLWGDLEGRMWLGDRDARGLMKGHFLGLYAGAGLYDFQWRDADGYQGEFFLAAGLSYGYCLPLNKSLNLEFELGFGYLQSDYRHYYHIVEADGTSKLIRDRLTGTLSYWGPTKAKISLVIPLQWKVKTNNAK